MNSPCPLHTVSVHALWGLLLGLFALFRFLTYFFLYLRPPASILPSRPPTEALAALSLTCGGIVFMLSTEQVTFAAMRHGADDLMAGLNVTVAFASVAFAWIMVLFAIQGELPLNTRQWALSWGFISFMQVGPSVARRVVSRNLSIRL